MLVYRSFANLLPDSLRYQPGKSNPISINPADCLLISILAYRLSTTMNLTELKNTPVSELVQLGESMGLENLARAHKEDIIFAILKAHAKGGEDIFGDGVLEILTDGFGFLRSADGSYLRWSG